MIDFFLSEEQKMIRDMVRDFTANEIAPIAAELDEKGKFPSEIIAKMGELGLMGVPFPEEYGGAGMDYVSYATAVYEIARVCASTAITMAAHTSLGMTPIYLVGSEKQKRKYIPPLASGEMIGAFGLTEASAGSDAAATKTTAIKKGDEWIINGSKVFTTNAGVAGIISITAKVIEDEKKKGLALLSSRLTTRACESGRRKRRWDGMPPTRGKFSSKTSESLMNSALASR